MKRVSSSQLLPILLGAALAAAGWMQGLQWRQDAGAEGKVDSVEVVALQQQVDQLTQENAALRSLAQGGGEFSVPPELVARVEKQLGLSFVSTPVIHRLAGEELRDRVKASLEARYGEGGLEDRQKAYQLIGWLGVEDNLAGQLAALRAVGARAWFDEVSGEGWVTDRFQLANVPDQASLLRVLARILLEQHYPLAKGRIWDDALRARDALHSGVAAGVEAKFFQDNARAIGFMSLTQDTEASQLLLSLPPFIQGWSSFLGIEGKTYADQLVLKGREALVQKLQDPPQKTADVMFLFERVLPDRRCALPETPGEVVLEDHGGALGLSLWLNALGDVQASRTLAEALLHDQWRLFATDDRSHHVVWCIELRDQAAADEASAAFCALGAAIADQPEDLKLGQAVNAPDGTWLRIDRTSPTGLRLTRTSHEKVMQVIR
jgi:hypothetical protein